MSVLIFAAFRSIFFPESHVTGKRKCVNVPSNLRPSSSSSKSSTRCLRHDLFFVPLSPLSFNPSSKTNFSPFLSFSLLYPDCVFLSFSSYSPNLYPFLCIYHSVCLSRSFNLALFSFPDKSKGARLVTSCLNPTVTSLKSPPPPLPLEPAPPSDLAHLVDAIEAENQNFSALSIASASRAALDLRPPSSLPNLRTHSSRLKDMDALRDKSSSAPLHRDDDDGNPRASGLAASAEARRPKSETGERRKGRNPEGDKPAVTNDPSVEISVRSDVSRDEEEPSPSRNRMNSDAAASAASVDHDFHSYPRLSHSPPSKDTGEFEAEFSVHTVLDDSLSPEKQHVMI